MNTGTGTGGEELTVHYFSNGTEGRMWMANWCDRCTNDHVTHSGENHEQGCPHIVEMMMHRPIPAMVEVPGPRYAEWHCMDFRRCPCDRGPDDPGEEPPVPVDPNQGALFDGDACPPGVPRGAFLDAMPVSAPARVSSPVTNGASNDE